MVDEEQKPTSVLVTRNYHIALKAGQEDFRSLKPLLRLLPWE